MAKVGWGGARKGAGRKPNPNGRTVGHRARPAHRASHPVHVMLRGRAGLPSFREPRVAKLVDHQVKRLGDKTFKIVHVSVQPNQIDMLVEAKDGPTITRKMMGFTIAFARVFNRDFLKGKRGKVWADRYYRRDIADTRELKTLLRSTFAARAERR